MKLKIILPLILATAPLGHSEIEIIEWPKPSIIGPVVTNQWFPEKQKISFFSKIQSSTLVDGKIEVVKYWYQIGIMTYGGSASVDRVTKDIYIAKGGKIVFLKTVEGQLVQAHVAQHIEWEGEEK